MPRSTVRIAVDVLADCLPLIKQAASITGSAACEGEEAVALVIEGDSVPACEQCLCEVLSLHSATDTRITLTFKPV